MPSNFTQGFMGTPQALVEARNDITVFIRNWFANRNPLVTRLPYVPVETVQFDMYGHPYRARSTTLTTTAISSGATASITVADNTFLMKHDVLSWTDSVTGVVEYFQLAADPNADGHTLAITRGVSVTTPATSVPIASVINLIGNARSGDEIQQTALTTVGTLRRQYAQTYQFPVDIGGSAQTARAQVLPGGIQTPLDFNMTMQLQHMVDDIENTCYYGLAQAPNSGTGAIAMADGIKSILTTNNTTAPISASAYGSTDLIRDTLQKARQGGGEPDLLLVSTGWMSAFAIWGQAIQRVPAGETEFGTPINMLEAPFLHGVMIIEAPLLRDFTAIALTSSEVYIRNKRNPFWQLRGSLGDRVQGDWIAEMGICVINEPHHAWLEGVTAFSPN